jgi:hypothetical protein
MINHTFPGAHLVGTRKRNDGQRRRYLSGCNANTVPASQLRKRDFEVGRLLQGQRLHFAQRASFTPEILFTLGATVHFSGTKLCSCQL